MKKIIALICAVLLCLSFTGCKKAAEPTPLTIEKAAELLTTETTVWDITRWSVYNGALGTTQTGFKSCKITVAVSAKQAVALEGASITFDLIPNDQRYQTLTDQTLTLSADGTASGIYKYEDKQEGDDNPSFTVRITNVSGTLQ